MTQEQKKPMSLAKAIFWVGFFIFNVCMAAYWIHRIYQMQVVEPAELAAEDARYEAYGCYISDGGDMYTCPNGLPPEEPGPGPN